MNKNFFALIPLPFIFVLAACSATDETYIVNVQGNVYNESGQPKKMLAGQFCWTLHFSNSPDSAQCDSITTNNEGQFSDIVDASAESSSATRVDNTLTGYELYLKTADGSTYPGQVIQKVAPQDNGKYNSTTFNYSITVNFNVNQ
jgi:hypothetical protein